MDRESPPDLGRDVVPGRYDPGALEATRVVRRRHVRARNEEQAEHLVTVLERSPPRVGAREVREDLRVIVVDDDGHEDALQTVGGRYHEHPGAGLAHDSPRRVL